MTLIRENEMDKTEAMKIRFIRLVVMISAALFAVASVSAQSSNSNMDKILKRPIVLKASKLMQLQGVKPDSIQVICKRSVDKGIEKIGAIPFQVDELDGDAFPVVNGVVNSGAETAFKLNSFDGEDEILFLAADGGERFSQDELDRFGAIYEVKYRYLNQPRYAYITPKKLLPNSDTHYVSFDEDRFLLATNYYQLQLDKTNPVVWRGFYYPRYRGEMPGAGHSLLDTMKVRLNSGVFTRFMKIKLSNKNLKAKILRVKQGAIRTIIQLQITVVVAKIPIMKIGMQLHVMPQMIDFPALVYIPGIFDRVMVEPTMMISLDWNNLRGSKVYVANYPDAPAIVDGKLSSHEVALQQKGISNYNNWLAIDSGHNFASVMNLALPKDEDVGILSFYYDDNYVIADEPEYILGQSPNMGWKVKDMPSNVRYYITPSLFFVDHIQDIAIDQLVEQGKYFTDTQVSALQ